MYKIFVLGHKGMLGNAVIKFFSNYPEKYSIKTTHLRFGDLEFNNELINDDSNFIINCIGAIPQKYSKQPEKYKELNIDLPIFLESLNKKIVHPSTDCEFSGNLPLDKKYKKNSIRDAEDEYGKSKSYISKKIEEEFKNTKIIRVSIIGHEEKSNLSLLEWILSTKEQKIRGYVDHYWNGVTTIEWCKLCQNLINNWDNEPIIRQFGTENILNKYNLVKLIADIYKKDITVEPYETGKVVNKCLESDYTVPDIETQIKELKEYYGK